jgi:hypothetical protein
MVEKFNPKTKFLLGFAPECFPLFTTNWIEGIVFKVVGMAATIKGGAKMAEK